MNKKTVYKVEFNWGEGYMNFDLGVRELTICVIASSQFDALRIAFDSIASLDVPEPTKFSASRKKEDC